MNVVSFETAKRLKEAGFPQPEINEEGIGYYWARVENNSPMLYAISKTWLYEPDTIELAAYAPTACELLLDGWILVRNSKYSFEGDDYWVCCQEEEWADRILKWKGSFYTYARNPAEAAAEAWMYANEKETL